LTLTLGSRADVAEERLQHGGDTAAENQNIGIKQVDDIAEPKVSSSTVSTRISLAAGSPAA